MRFGPQILDDCKVKFNLWAPSAKSVGLVLNGKKLALNVGKKGCFELITEAKTNDKYKFQIDNNLEIPDPASRFQPEDVDGPSQVVSIKYNWHNWNGRPWEEAVIYELHVGTFSKAGTYKGVQKRLDYLADLGVTAIELMPLSDFKGDRGWGYDGVFPYAPDSVYGTPEDLKELIDTAHQKNIMVFLDVVYNHFGPAGNYLHEYAKTFFTEKYITPWGAAIDFENSPEVREFFIQNALYWLNEYKFDGLRFDAVHAITDNSDKHFLHDLAEQVRAEIPKDRYIHLVLENEKNQSRYLVPGHFNAQWNDDIHHAFHVLLTGETSGYYADYKDKPLALLGRCLTEGFAYQGDPSPTRNGELRGEKSSHLPPTSFINFLQNHDQIGNRAFGDRLTTLADKNNLETAMVMLLLNPAIPMLYMGEEFGSETPFQYFCNFDGDLAKAVSEGRRKEFPSEHTEIPDPNDEKTFLNSKLDWNDLDKAAHKQSLNLTTTLLKLRHQHIVPLLKAGWVKSGFEIIEDNSLEIEWVFKGNKTLKMSANLSGDPVNSSQKGQTIWDKPACKVVIGND